MARSGRGRRPGGKGRGRTGRPVERAADGSTAGEADPDAGRTADLGRVVGPTGGSRADAGTPADLAPVGDTAGSARSDAGLDPNAGAGVPLAADRAPAATAPTHTVLLPSVTADDGASPRAWQPEPPVCPVCRIPPAPGATTCPDCREDLAPLLFLRSRADRGYNAALADAVDGRHAAARDELRWVLADNARHVPALVLLGKVHARLGADTDARAAWQRALRLAPGHETATACLGALPTDKPTPDG